VRSLVCFLYFDTKKLPGDWDLFSVGSVDPVNIEIELKQSTCANLFGIRV